MIGRRSDWTLLEKALPFSRKMKNSVLLLDGYTGFTPIQMRVVGELLAVL